MKTRKFLTKALALVLVIAMLAMPAFAKYQPVDIYGSGGGMGLGMPGDMGGGAPPPPPPGGGSMTFYTGAALTEAESTAYDGTVFPDSTGDAEVAVRVNPGVSASMKDATVTKSGGDLTGDDSSFYGVNSGILAYSEDAATPASLTIENSNVTTNGQGANGVFAYGDATISIKNSTNKMRNKLII